MVLTRRELLLAGSGSLLLGHAIDASANRSESGKARLMQGPMLGAVEEDRIRVWVRTSEAADLTLELSARPDFQRILARTDGHTSAQLDHTAVLTAGGLTPATDYFYRVRINGAHDPYLEGIPASRARTAPSGGVPASFSVAFGSCARYARDPVQPIWAHVRDRGPDLFLWLGDNVYGDSLNPEILAEEYRRQREVASFQAVGRTVPQLAIWDDHDYGLNNHDRTHPMRETALATFQRYWANPAYGAQDTPGVFFRYRYGAVDFFMLDGRYHRDPNDAEDTPGKTMLGTAQREWLLRELAASPATFKVLACGSGWTRAKGPGGDSWAAFLDERDALFEFIRQRDIGGVVLLSGDTHVGELNAIPCSERGGYDLYDLVSSPLAQPSDDDWLQRTPELRIRPVHFAGTNFGLLRFDFSATPRLTYELIGDAGRPVWAPLELAAAELRNGVTSWRSKIDPSLERSLPA